MRRAPGRLVPLLLHWDFAILHDHHEQSHDLCHHRPFPFHPYLFPDHARQRRSHQKRVTIEIETKTRRSQDDDALVRALSITFEDRRVREERPLDDRLRRLRLLLNTTTTPLAAIGLALTFALFSGVPSVPSLCAQSRKHLVFVLVRSQILFIVRDRLRTPQDVGFHLVDEGSAV
ncbi:hypothetical protein D9619_007961 [Psilocybe cf. subviscida]|uniref:Uncharacterized protein n=1 Tax=Psilocybe cf. subviscida TaxID=2480587 RepID=A0A8H5AU27_9AGAR|nr:hypothetical protein D9619_007961 [Psilocybe cf. subviscida]